MGGIVLHQGKIAEMKTGEGKTLVATLPLYLNALTCQGCHLVTVNDYLARRDAYWMSPILHALGMTTASIYPTQGITNQLPALLYDPDYTDEKDTRWPHFHPIERRQAYEADITYGTNNEFGFDYLRDNMAMDLSQRVQRPLNYPIVDEVDNILIDEARTPLIISGTAEEATKKYEIFARLIPQLKKDDDYTIEEKEQHVYLTDSGMTNMESWLRREGLLKAPGLYDPANYGLNQYMDNALKAHAMFKRDRNYVVKDGQVIIVDEFTGRLMFGRRYSEGLHQAIEAKERVRVQKESITLATITFQNYFRLYKKLAGMTGTAATEAEEFYKIYKLDVITIPTNKPMIRSDNTDQIYKDEDSKFKAVANEIESFHKQGRPVLIGTVSIDKSEHLSEHLKRKGIPHELLNAKNHEKEAAIIAQAGRLGAVTVATNMAGRGVDIILGGQHEDISPLTNVESYFRDIYNQYGDKEDQYIEYKEFMKEGGRYTDNDSFYKVCNDIIKKLKSKYEEFKRWLASEAKSGQTKEQSDTYKKSKEKELEEKKKWIEKYEKCREWIEKYENHIEWIQNHGKVMALGGLHVIGTERHEAKRIDNQLRGRAGRQGDPGSSRFYVSLEDDIARRFGGDRVKGFMEWAGFDENTPIEHPMVSKAIENAQDKVTGYHFDMRKHLVEYDDVVNKHREVIYAERNKILEGADLKANILSMVQEEIQSLVAAHCVDDYSEPDFTGLVQDISDIFPMPPQLTPAALAQVKPKQATEKLIDYAHELYEQREKEIGSQDTRLLERVVMLRTIDSLWMEHLTAMDHLRQDASLHAMGQIDPLVIYKKEGHALFESLMANIRHDVVHNIYKLSITRQEVPQQKQPQKQAQKFAIPSGRKIGRNDPCPCGSGKKYKHCCGG
jgi:preprotein translocase subunit SecA